MIKKTLKGRCSTGDCSTGHRSTGDWSTGNWSTGNSSTGHFSTGRFSTGDCSTGYFSTGYFSTGDCSTGHYSTGNYSTGHRSTGDWSISDYSTGHFSTENYTGFGAFDKPCSVETWRKAKKPGFLYFKLTKWIKASEMSKKEKTSHPEYKTTLGYLKVYTYKQAWRNSWEELKKKGKEEIKWQVKLLEALPNFNYEKFVQISGIDYRKETF